MKSIIEQASSIIKAIEKAWNQAEQPKEFSIKIFEKEEKNFFGMTTKPAKVGIFFGDKQIIHEKPTQRPRPEIKECRPSVSKTVSKISDNKSEDAIKTQTHKPYPASKAIGEKPLPKKQFTEKSEQQPKASTQQNVVNKQQLIQPKKEKVHVPAVWSDGMIASVHNWLKKTLELMNMGTIEFSSEVAGKNLKLIFNKPLLSDAVHEKQLFRSFVHLIMSSLRNQYKQEMKDLKVILIRPE